LDEPHLYGERNSPTRLRASRLIRYKGRLCTA